MADVVTKTRTNYFHAPDPDKLRDLLSRAKTDGGEIKLVQDPDKNTVMFYCSGEIEGILTTEAQENLKRDPDWADDHPEAWSIDAFLEELSGLIAPGDACIVKAVGSEAMRCIFAGAHIVTNEKIQYVSFDNVLLQKTRSMLADPGYYTCLS